MLQAGQAVPPGLIEKCVFPEMLPDDEGLAPVDVRGVGDDYDVIALYTGRASAAAPRASRCSRASTPRRQSRTTKLIGEILWPYFGQYVTPAMPPMLSEPPGADALRGWLSANDDLS